MAEYKTLADLIRVWDDLPDVLNFEPDESKGDRMYENVERLTEAKSLRYYIRKFCFDKPKQDWTWENFSKQFPDFIKENDMHSYDFKREMGLIEKGTYEIYDPDKETVNVETADTRPDFNPNDANSDPIMIALYKALGEVNSKTDSVEQAVLDKYTTLLDTARNIANGSSTNSHAFICGEAGIGKSFSVEKGIEQGLGEWVPNKKHKNKPKWVSCSGSIGTSFTDLLIFFYQNRHEKVILLDDCDGFLVGNDQNIANFLKRLLNTKLGDITTPRTIRNNANRQINAENESCNSIKINVNTSKLLEGKCSVTYDNTTFDFNVSLKEAAKLMNTFGFKKHITEKKMYDPLHQVDKYVNKLKFFEAEDEESNDLTEEEQAKLDEIEAAAKEEGLANEEIDTELEIPEKWIFDSNLIMISNLDEDQVDEAVTSRCDVYEIHLTKAEFFCRCEQILDKLEVGEYSSTPQEVIQWAKREAFALLKIMVMGSKQFKNVTVPVNVRLDFRFVGNKATNRVVARANEWQRKTHKSLTEPQNRAECELAIRDEIMRDLIRLLRGKEIIEDGLSPKPIKKR